MRKVSTTRICAHQNTRYATVLNCCPAGANKGPSTVPIGVQALPLLAAYSKPSTRASVRMTRKIKPRIIKPSQGPCKALLSWRGRTMPRRMAKTIRANNTRTTKLSRMVAKIGLSPSKGSEPLNAFSIELSRLSWIIIKPQKVKKCAIPGRGSRSTPL